MVKKIKIDYLDLKKIGGTSASSTSTSTTNNSNFFVRFAILVNVIFKNDPIFVREEKKSIDDKLHKTIFSIKTDEQKFNLAKDDLIDFLRKRKNIYKAIFPNISTNYKIMNKYYFQLLDESYKIYYDAMTTDLLNFLREKNLITPGTDENIPPWMKNLEDGPEKDEKMNLYYMYGTAQAPPLMSHHLTLNYNLDEKYYDNGIFENENKEEIEINYAGIVISNTNAAGQLTHTIFTEY